MSYSLCAEKPSAVPFGTNIRTVVKDGSPVFVLKDVCEALGIADCRAALDGLLGDEHLPVELQADGAPQTVEAVNEFGLYSLALSAPNETGKGFAAWVSRALVYKAPSLHPVVEFVRLKTAEASESGKARKERDHA